MGYINQLLSQTKSLWVEAFGTFLLVLVSTSALVTLNLSGQAMSASVMLVGILAYAFTYGWLIFALDGWQQGYFNPAVTVLCWLRGQVTLTWLAAAILVQLAGGLLASIAVALLFGPMAVNIGLGAVHPLSNMGPIAAAVAETVGTLFLLVSIIKVRAEDNAAKRGLLIGCSLAIGQLLTIGISGAGLNPIRVLAPQLVAADAGNWWVYVTGPLLAAIAVWAGAGWLHQPTDRPTSPEIDRSAHHQTETTEPKDVPEVEVEQGQHLQQEAEQAVANLRQSEDAVSPKAETSLPPLQPSFQPDEQHQPPASSATPATRKPLPKPSSIQFVDFNQPDGQPESTEE